MMRSKAQHCSTLSKKAFAIDEAAHLSPSMFEMETNGGASGKGPSCDGSGGRSSRASRDLKAGATTALLKSGKLLGTMSCIDALKNPLSWQASISLVILTRSGQW